MLEASEVKRLSLSFFLTFSAKAAGKDEESVSVDDSVRLKRGNKNAAKRERTNSDADSLANEVVIITAATTTTAKTQQLKCSECT